MGVENIMAEMDAPHDVDEMLIIEVQKHKYLYDVNYKDQLRKAKACLVSLASRTRRYGVCLLTFTLSRHAKGRHLRSYRIWPLCFGRFCQLPACSLHIRAWENDAFLDCALLSLSWQSG